MFEKFKARFFESKVVLKFIILTKKTVLPGFDKLPVYYVAKFFILGIKNGLMETKASSIAFKFFMALFPTIIFILTLIPYFPVDNFREDLLKILEDILPESAYLFAEESIVNLVTKTDGGLLSIGFIFALYLATNGIEGMLAAFKESYNVTIERSALSQKILSVSLLFILTLLVIIALGAIAFSQYLVFFIFDEGTFASQAVNIGKWLIIAALCFFGISFIYYLGGNRKMKWRFFSAGSTLATVLVLIVSLGFGYYVDNFANYNKIYGSIGAIIIIMLWFYFNSFVLLLGFELNASIQQAGGSIERIEKKIDSGKLAHA